MENLSKLKPSNGYVIIKDIPDTKKDSTIIYKSDKEDAYVTGKVYRVGGAFKSNEGATIDPPCKEGDIVIYSFSGFEEIEVGNERVRIVRFQNVIAHYEQ